MARILDFPMIAGGGLAAANGYGQRKPTPSDLRNPEGGQMKKPLIVGILAACVLGLAIGLPAQQMMQGGKGEMMSPTKSMVELRTAMRKLWEDHVTYTRNYIISALAGLEDAGAVAKRLLANQDDLGNAIVPYYGADAGKKLAALLRDHILIATEVVKAAKMGNAMELATAQNKWTGNADEIAAFLSGANPHWPKAALTDMLHKHLAYTTDEVVSRLKKDWAADVDAYDKGHVHMLMFADMLTEGVIKQFPAKFKN
jgi:hypothetical protein